MGLLAQRAGLHLVRYGRVADVRLRARARQVPHHRDHAAVVLEVVVGVDEVVLAGVDVLRGDGDAPERDLHVPARRPPVQPAPVRVAAPHRVHLGEVGVGAPVAGVDQGEETGAVRARLGAEDAGGGAAPVAVLGGVLVGVRADVVAVGGLVQLGHRAHRVVDQAHDVRERVPEEAGDADRDVDARPAQLLQAHHVETGHAARGVVPDRAAAEQREDLGDVVALGAHRGRAPDRQTDGLGVLARVLQVPLHQGVGERLPDLPTQPGRDRLGVDGVEVATGRQDVHQPAGR